MKKTALYAALFALTSPLSLFALGLGEMKVHSLLDQPFQAEIELVDVGSTSLASIKVGIADPDNFQRAGVEPIAALSLLNFAIERNEQGRFVIKVRSTERMSEPYMQLVVDLIWPNGQLYRAYTVLLDPPGYQLVSTRSYGQAVRHKTYNEPGVIDKTVYSQVERNPVMNGDGKSKTTYGPTITNENVWQIAQRYKSSDLMLPQVVLALVGANPAAFKYGNLNGLKVGVRLDVPSTLEMLRIPVDLATEEVMAHDKAWNDKTAINHVLTPPYIGDQVAVPPPSRPAMSDQSAVSSIPGISPASEMPKVPQLKSVHSDSNTMSQLINWGAPGILDTQPQPTAVTNPQSNERSMTTQAELSITKSAIDSMRESNALLMEQLHLLQQQNKKLQQQLNKREKDVELIRSQMDILIKERTATASQASAAAQNSSSSWALYLLLLAAAGGAGFAYWHFRLRPRQEEEYAHLAPSTEMKPFIQPPKTPPAQQTPVLVTPVVQEPSTSAAKVDLNPVSPVLADTPHAADAVALSAEAVVNNEHIQSIEPEVDSGSTAKAEISETSSPESDNAVLEPITPDATEKDVQKPNNLPVEEENNNQHSSMTAEDDQNTVINDPEVKQEVPEFMEFEPGLHKLIEEAHTDSKIASQDTPDDMSQSLDFTANTEVNPDQSKSNDIPVLDEAEPMIKLDHTPEEDVQTFDMTSNGEYHNLDLDSPNPEPAPQPEPVSPVLDQSITDFFMDEAEKPSDEKLITASEQDFEPSEATEDGDDGDEGDDDTANPLKSKKAFDTLLALAKTYLSMDDFESARTSLEEVLEQGSESQKEDARRLLDEIKDK